MEGSRLNLTLLFQFGDKGVMFPAELVGQVSEAGVFSNGIEAQNTKGGGDDSALDLNSL